jgi:hypothetical protein
MSFQGNIFSFIPVYTPEHVALILIFLALFRPLCSSCSHICVCVSGEKEDREREGGRWCSVRAYVFVYARVCVCVCMRACVWTQPLPYNLTTKIKRLKKEKANFNLEQI